MKRLLLALLLAPVAAAGEPEVLSDDWQVIRIFGQDSGYAHTRVVRRGDIVETTVDTSIVMKRAGAEIKMATTETTEERFGDGSIVRIRSVRRGMSEWDVHIDVRFEGTKAIMVTKIGEQANEATKECGKGVVGPYRIEQLAREAGYEKGTKLDARTYLTDLGGPADLTITIGGEEEVELLDGKKRTLVRIETLFKVGFKPITWVDREGRLHKTKVSLGGMEMESYSASEERARGAAGTAPAALPDSFDLTLIAPLHPVPFPRRLDRATYRIRAKEAMPDFADGRQTVEEAGEGAVLLRIERRVPSPGRAKRPVADVPDELAPCMRPSSQVQSDAPEIAKIAADVAGADADAWGAAQKLERWVHDNITEKSMDVGFASALEVCKNRQGDCTEHAVLLCALARAAGIPSRVVMGLTCIGNAFGGHAWTEVWIGGEWFALDGTLGHGSVDPTHITLARMTLEDAEGAEGFLGLLQGLGNLEIEPVEVVLGGRALDPAAAPRIEGGRFESRLWGVAFTLPEGYEPAELEPEASMMARVARLAGESGGGPCSIHVLVTDAAVWEIVRNEKRFASFKESKVDGRPAFGGALDGRRRAYVLVDAGLFAFEMDAAAGKPDADVFAQFLASVDFDVK